MDRNDSIIPSVNHPDTNSHKRSKSTGPTSKNKRAPRILPANLQNDDLMCAICYEFNASPSLTPCDHLFCINCLEKGQELKNQCPICRAEFPADYDPEIDVELTEHIAKNYAKEFGQRKEE